MTSMIFANWFCFLAKYLNNLCLLLLFLLFSYQLLAVRLFYYCRLWIFSKNVCLDITNGSNRTISSFSSSKGSRNNSHILYMQIVFCFHRICVRYILMLEQVSKIMNIYEQSSLLLFFVIRQFCESPTKRKIVVDPTMITAYLLSR